MEMNTLHFDPASPWWVHAGAALILFLHIAGGSVALVAGAAALAVRKGSRLHRQAGNVFFGSMLVMAAIGAAVSPVLVSPDGDGRWFDALAAMLALYLTGTGWLTVRRKAGTTGRAEVAMLLFGAATAAAAFAGGAFGAASPSGTIGGYDPSGYFVFGTIFALASVGDLAMILRGGAIGAGRIVRHIWRISTALFIAAGAFFFGQQAVMPEFVQGSPWLALPPFAVLGLMLFWVLRTSLARRINSLARKRRIRREAA